MFHLQFKETETHIVLHVACLYEQPVWITYCLLVRPENILVPETHCMRCAFLKWNLSKFTLCSTCRYRELVIKRLACSSSVLTPTTLDVNELPKHTIQNVAQRIVRMCNYNESSWLKVLLFFFFFIYHSSLVFGECLLSDSILPGWRWNWNFFFNLLIKEISLLCFGVSVFAHFVLLYICFFNLGTRTVSVAPETAVYCQCAMPMDVLHAVQKRVVVAVRKTVFLSCLHHFKDVSRAPETSSIIK